MKGREPAHDNSMVFLVVDDSEADAELLKRGLSGIAEFKFELLYAGSFDEAGVHLARPDIDIIFLDYLLGAMTGEDVLKALRARGDNRPVIVLTGYGDEETAAAFMRNGAADYISKQALDSITLRRAITNAQAQEARRRFELANRQLLEKLQDTKLALEKQNQRLGNLYNTAHEFVDHVAHEFRTPLTVIREYASLIAEGLMGTVNQEQIESLQMVVSRVDALSSLVDDMLDISKLEAGMLGVYRKDCQIGGVLEQVRCALDRRARSANVTLEIKALPDLPDVYCDPDKIGRVLINLVVNALKFCNEGGQVVISAKPRCEASELLVRVEDTGPGIAKEDLEQLFGRFQQVGGDSRTGVKGFGLGLSIARELVHLNLGDISVESEVGRGSVFSFTVPYSSRRELIERYVSRVGRFRDDTRYVSLLELNSDPAAERKVLLDVEQLIQHNIRRTDIFFVLEAHRWAIVAAANRKNLEPMVDRLRKIHETAAHRASYQSMPKLTIRTIGAWSLDTETNEAIERILELIEAKELALV